jgi:hypothetical protein
MATVQIGKGIGQSSPTDPPAVPVPLTTPDGSTPFSIPEGGWVALQFGGGDTFTITDNAAVDPPNVYTLVATSPSGDDFLYYGEDIRGTPDTFTITYDVASYHACMASVYSDMPTSDTLIGPTASTQGNSGELACGPMASTFTNVLAICALAPEGGIVAAGPGFEVVVEFNFGAGGMESGVIAEPGEITATASVNPNQWYSAAAIFRTNASVPASPADTMFFAMT